MLSRLQAPLPWLYAAFLYAFIFLPVVVLVLFSFQDGGLPLPPLPALSLRWYEAIFADSRLMHALLRSLGVAALSSLLSCALGFFAACAFARYRLPASHWLRALLVAPLTVSTLIIGLGLLQWLNLLGIPLSLWTVGIGHVVINLPLCFAIVYASMGAQQVTVERAARDLGAGEWQVLGLVTAPMLAPSLFAAFFLSFTFSWDEFIVAFLLSRFEPTLPVEIFGLLRAGLNPRLNAIGSLVFLVSIALLVLAELTLLRKSGASR